MISTNFFPNDPGPARDQYHLLRPIHPIRLMTAIVPV